MTYRPKFASKSAKKSSAKVRSVEDSLHSNHSGHSSTSAKKSCMKVRSLEESLHSIVSDRKNNNNGLQYSPSSALDRSVSFHKVQIREHKRSIADNPAVSHGPPIGLGWEYDPEHSVLSVDEYESGKNPRSAGQMAIPKHVREEILKDEGYSRQEIADAVRGTIKVKFQRNKTVNNLNLHKIEEALESAKRKIKRFIFRRQRDREMEKILRAKREYARKVIEEENEASLMETFASSKTINKSSNTPENDEFDIKAKEEETEVNSILQKTSTHSTVLNTCSPEEKEEYENSFSEKAQARNSITHSVAQSNLEDKILLKRPSLRCRPIVISED